MSNATAGRLAAALAALAALTACAGAPATRSAADLTNPSLSPAWSQWLVGPVARLATEQEARAYLELADDEAAADFVEAFWRRRDPTPERPGNPLRELFAARAEEADRRFSEAGYLGRRTARGTVWVLYGEPAEMEYEISPRPGGEPIEMWTYDRDGATGLDGRRPDVVYRFVKRGDLTMLYRPLPDVERPSQRPGGG